MPRKVSMKFKMVPATKVTIHHYRKILIKEEEKKRPDFLPYR